MTTGRINQVTTFRPCTPRGATHDSHDQSHFLVREFINLVEDSTVTLEGVPHFCIVTIQSQRLNHLIPRSHKFQEHFSLSLTATEIMTFRENYQQPALSHGHCTVTADSQVVKCNRFSYQQVIHILLHCKHQRCLTLIGKEANFIIAWPEPIPSQYSLIDRCIYNSVQGQPVIP
jgi:hypothetical protein